MSGASYWTDVHGGLGIILFGAVMLAGFAVLIVLELRRSNPVAEHEHNCIPVRRFFQRRWVCVRCDRIFRENVR